MVTGIGGIRQGAGAERRCCTPCAARRRAARRGTAQRLAIAVTRKKHTSSTHAHIGLYAHLQQLACDFITDLITLQYVADMLSTCILLLLLLVIIIFINTLVAL